ncbi:hypothetical protein BpHYR1_042566 [Brachionus plicatilis]|uniref:RRM domain-containing protein n=1 Tax=Brachionus plicatilis TaxID=10195 RepID=A0A3M7SAX3_BRAPC|nr:hypothetical protein BpHYR1_042566 [Brachionus plicatilis]
MIYDLIIKNVPSVVNSRYSLKTRLNDRAREEGLSQILVCHLVSNNRMEPGHAFVALTRLEDNEAMLDWTGMVFHGSRLKFEVNRVCGVRRRKMEAELRLPQRKEDDEEFSGPENLPDDDPLNDERHENN